MTRHIEFTIDFDFTCWGEDMEDFGDGSIETITDSLHEFICDDGYELLDYIKIKKVWYEED